jgi:Hypothetical glycosyl hydrolase family 15
MEQRGRPPTIGPALYTHTVAGHRKHVADQSASRSRTALRTRLAAVVCASLLAACADNSSDDESGTPVDSAPEIGTSSTNLIEPDLRDDGDQVSDDGSEPVDEVEQGRLNVLVHAKTAFDPWTLPTDEPTWATLRSTYDAMIVYSPYFDQRAQLFENTFVYIDMYGLKVNNPNETIALDHPDWVLRTADGEPVYIPWGCESPNGCPQFAADVGSPEYQDDFVERVRRLVDLGYQGIHIDDVNLAWRLSDSAGNRVTPLNPRTGAELTIDEWRSDVVDLMERVRSEFPGTRIMHNSIWFADSPDFADDFVDRQIAAADVIMLERGANDAGLVRSDGQFGFGSFIKFVDRVHDLGANVLLLDQSATTDREQVFNLVTGLLVNDGGDFVSTQAYDQMAPESLWSGFRTDLGPATGSYSEQDGIWRRDFERGIVVLNEPDRETLVVDLGGEFIGPDGSLVSQVTLQAREAVVLRNP